MKSKLEHHDDEVLYRDKSVMICSSRVETKAAGYAVKYISTLKVKAVHPPKSEALGVILISLFGMLALIYYRMSNMISSGMYVILVGMVLIALLMGGFVYWFVPSRYTMKVSLINGDSFTISASSESKICKIQTAIRTAMALNRMDPVAGPPTLTNVVGKATG